MNCSTGLKPILSDRLLAAAQHIVSCRHIDIGSDHAQLPRYLLETGRVKEMIVVEKHPKPFRRARHALKGYAAEVRLGDGLKDIKADKAESLSITGMGAKTILKILSAAEKLPSKLVLQANDDSEDLRNWALKHAYGLKHESMVRGFWPYTILSLEACPKESSTFFDPSYEGLEPDLALKFGPLLLKQRHAILYESLNKQAVYYEKKQSQPWAQKKLELIQRALAYYAR